MKPRKPGTEPPEILRRLDSLFRRGFAVQARRDLRAVVRARPKQVSPATLANLCWRAGVAELGIRLLHRHVYPPPRSVNGASDFERAEYAACLIRIGRPAEAWDLLADVDDRAVPEALLYRAYSLIHRWEYGPAVEPLSRFIDSSPTPYARTVASLNLASSLAFTERFHEAEVLLEGVRERAAREGWGLIAGNALENLADIAFQRGDWAAAEAALSEAGRLLAGSARVYGLLVRRLRAFVRLDRIGASGLSEIRAVQREAGALGHWETIRDCDRYLACRTHDRALAHRLFYGTPFEGFRAKLRRALPDCFPPPSKFEFRLGRGERADVRVELSTGIGGTEPLEPGGLAHRTLLALISDFYRPSRIPMIHARLYPGERYHPEVSPDRVSFALGTLRRWARRSGVPLGVSRESGWYRLEARAPIVLVIPDGTFPSDKLMLRIAAVRERLGDGPFTAREVSRAFSLSERQALRLLSEATRRGALSVTPTPLARRFRFGT